MSKPHRIGSCPTSEETIRMIKTAVAATEPGHSALHRDTTVRSPAHAGVEFVTEVGACSKVDTIGDGKDLRLAPGPNTRFEVWGSGIDVNPSVRVTTSDSNAGTVSARIVSVKSGPQNAAGPCKYATGSALVELSSPITATTNLRRTLRFRMPLGDESPLATTVFAYRDINHTWQNPSMPLCLSRGMGTARLDLNNERLTISLPPGAGSDTSNCTMDLTSSIGTTSSQAVDIRKESSYAISGQPSWMALDPASHRLVNLFGAGPRFRVDVLSLRRVTSVQTSTIVASTPNGHRDTITLVVNPPPPNGFTQPVACGIGGQAKAGEVFNCEARLAVTPPAAGQLVTFQIPSAACFEPAASNITYSASTGVGTVTLPGTGTIHQIPLRSKAGSGCSAAVNNVSHVLKFWIGPRADETGFLFSQANITITP